MIRYLFIFLIFISSCTTQRLVLTDLNTSGKIISVELCNCEFGKYIYKVELDPESKTVIDYITNDKYSVGKYIYFKTDINYL